MTTDDIIRYKKVKFNINREAAKSYAISSGKHGKYQYLASEEILASNQIVVIEQAKFTYSP